MESSETALSPICASKKFKCRKHTHWAAELIPSPRHCVSMHYVKLAKNRSDFGSITERRSPKSGSGVDSRHFKLGIPRLGLLHKGMLTNYLRATPQHQVLKMEVDAGHRVSSVSPGLILSCTSRSLRAVSLFLCGMSAFCRV